MISSSKYEDGDIIELQWEGPKNEFTAIKLSNGDK